MKKMKLVVPRSFAEYLDGETEITIQAKSRNELKDEIKNISSGLYRRIYDEVGNTRVFVKFFLGKRMLSEDEDIRFSEEEDTITVVSAVAGG